MTSPNRTKRTASAPTPSRSRILRFVDRIGVAELLIFAGTVGFGLWSWLAYVVAPSQDFPTFTVLFLGVSVLGGTLQVIMFAFVRASGTFRARVSLASVTESSSGSGVVFWGVPVLLAVGLLVTTPPSTSATGFDPSMSIYQVMLLMVVLSLAATISGFVLFGMVVLPVAWIIAGALPERASAPGRAIDSTVSRGELVTGGLLLFAVGGFSVAMYAVAPNVTGDGFGTRMRMIEQLSAFLTLRGDMFASVVVVLCVVAMVVLVILHNRYASRRVRSGTSPER